jgi:hypothetical protein
MLIPMPNLKKMQQKLLSNYPRTINASTPTCPKDDSCTPNSLQANTPNSLHQQKKEASRRPIVPIPTTLAMSLIAGLALQDIGNEVNLHTCSKQ